MISRHNKLFRLLSVSTQCLILIFHCSESMSLSSTKIRICQGSSCIGKCRGAFNPFDSFQELQNIAEETGKPRVKIKETFCMNQCKRGPNARIINDGNVLTFENGEMNDTEINRKAFQGILTKERVLQLWGYANGINNGNLVGIESGSADKLSDIMP
mmetsp:Transcript_5430/g.6941  ORF Transcript_5430/g.6941 Transcript_5430/m.6941 type:complete len:157 (-) Transcript_5430:166-636(-)